jgi:hypothetical protein
MSICRDPNMKARQVANVSMCSTTSKFWRDDICTRKSKCNCFSNPLLCIHFSFVHEKVSVIILVILYIVVRFTFLFSFVHEKVSAIVLVILYIFVHFSKLFTLSLYSRYKSPDKMSACICMLVLPTVLLLYQRYKGSHRSSCTKSFCRACCQSFGNHCIDDAKCCGSRKMQISVVFLASHFQSAASAVRVDLWEGSGA